MDAAELDQIAGLWPGINDSDEHPEPATLRTVPTPNVDVLAEVRAEVARLEQHAELSPDGYDTLNAILDREAGR